MNNHIQDKVVVITGASSGLGEATARHLAARGARLVLAARRTDRLHKLVAEITAAGGQALAVATDVARRADLTQLATEAKARFGRIDVLVNNAGVMPMAPMEKLKVDEWDQMIDVNVKGVLYGIAAVPPCCRACRRSKAGTSSTCRPSPACGCPLAWAPSTAPPNLPSRPSAKGCAPRWRRTTSA
jgi:NADP-dependent 3-hydroxy acid dehydrogenase YdfG